MTPELICRQLTGAGIHMRAEDGKLMVSPISQLTPDERRLLQDHKPELLDFLQRRTLEELLTAADHVCALYGDNDQAKEDMRSDVLATPPNLHADLLEHFADMQELHSSSAGYHSGFHAGFHQNSGYQVETTSTTTAHESTAHHD